MAGRSGARLGSARHRVALAIAALLLLAGIAAFVGVESAKRDAEDAIDAFYRRTGFADLTVSGGDVDAFAGRAQDVDGVAAVETRTTATMGVWVRGGKTKVEGQIVGIPTSHRIDTLDIEEGKEPDDSQAVVEHHTAADLGIRPGHSLQLLGLGGVEKVEVSGIAISPEYLVPAENQQQLLTARGSFAVLFLPEALAAQVSGAAAVPQAIVTYERGADHNAATRRLEGAARSAGAFLVEPRAQQPSNAVVDEELTGYSEAAIVAPWLLVSTAVLVAALAIGSSAHHLSTAGARSWRALLRAALLPTLIGTVAGVIAGLLVQRALLSSFLSSLGLPSSSAELHLGVLAIAVLLGLAAVVAAAVIAAAATRASGAADAVLDTGVGAFTAAGVALALVVVIGPAGIIDSVEATVDDATSLELADAQVAFAAQVDRQELEQLRKVDGVAIAEAVPSGHAALTHGDRSYETVLEAFAPDTELQRFESPTGQSLTLPRSGVLVSASLARLLDARPGDRLQLTVIGGSLPALPVRLAAITSDTLGNLAFMSIDALKDAVGQPTPFAGGLFNTAAMRFEAGADAEAIAAEVTAGSDVEVYVPVSDDLGEVANARPLLTDVTIALIVLGAIVGFLTLLNVGLAAPSAFGARHATRWRLVLTLAVPVVVGSVAGAIGGTVLANRLVDALESDLVHLDRTVTWSTYALAIGLQIVVVVIVLAVARWLDRPARQAS